MKLKLKEYTISTNNRGSSKIWYFVISSDTSIINKITNNQQQLPKPWSVTPYNKRTSPVNKLNRPPYNNHPSYYNRRTTKIPFQLNHSNPIYYQSLARSSIPTTYHTTSLPVPSNYPPNYPPTSINLTPALPEQYHPPATLSCYMPAVPLSENHTSSAGNNYSVFIFQSFSQCTTTHPTQLIKTLFRKSTTTSFLPNPNECNSKLHEGLQFPIGTNIPSITTQSKHFISLYSPSHVPTKLSHTHSKSSYYNAPPKSFCNKTTTTSNPSAALEFGYCSYDGGDWELSLAPLFRLLWYQCL